VKRLDILKGIGELDNISIETTSYCTNRCYMCPARKRTIKQGLMSDKTFEKIIKELAEYNYSGLLHLYAQGEPLLDKKLFERIEYTRKYLPNANIRLISNFVLLNDEIIQKLLNAPLNSLVISVYALDKETYKKICGRDHFDKVIVNLIQFCKEWAKKQPYMFSVFLIDSEYNEHDADFIQQFLEKLPCSEVARMPVYKIPGIAKRESKPLFFCLNIFSTLKIDINGDMSFCVTDVNSEMKIGNVKNDSLFSCFNSVEAKGLRKKLLFERNNKCDYCDFAGEHKILYFLLPVTSPVRSAIYSILNVQPIKGYKSKKRVYNTPKMIKEKAKSFDKLFNDDWIKTIEYLRDAK